MPSLTGGFNVFVAPTSGSDATAAGAGAGAPTGGEVTLGPGPAPLNSALLVEPRFEEPVPAQTAERCYVVTTVNPTQGGTVQSEPSASVCVSLKDTFAPAPPRNLAAVGGADSVNLIWERSEAPDLAGYVVLRAAGKGEPVPLNDTPMAETTFRDARAKAGVVYRYVVVAVDKAGNRSEPSNAVEVSAGQ